MPKAAPPLGEWAWIGPWLWHTYSPSWSEHNALRKGAEEGCQRSAGHAKCCPLTCPEKGKGEEAVQRVETGPSLSSPIFLLSRCRKWGEEECQLWWWWPPTVSLGTDRPTAQVSKDLHSGRRKRGAKCVLLLCNPLGHSVKIQGRPKNGGSSLKAWLTQNICCFKWPRVT